LLKSIYKKTPAQGLERQPLHIISTRKIQKLFLESEESDLDRIPRLAKAQLFSRRETVVKPVSRYPLPLSSLGWEIFDARFSILSHQ
jgi:hypothetical protein